MTELTFKPHPNGASIHVFIGRVPLGEFYDAGLSQNGEPSPYVFCPRPSLMFDADILAGIAEKMREFHEDAETFRKQIS